MKDNIQGNTRALDMLIGALVVVTFLIYIGFDELVPLLWAISYWSGLTALIVIVIALIPASVWAYAKIKESILKNRLINIDIAAKSQEIVSNEHGVYLVDHIDKYTRPLHLDPRLYQNGRNTEPTKDELYRWGFWITSKYGKNNIPTPLPEITVERPPDAIQLLAPLDRLMLVGGSGSGKTSMAQHLISSRSGKVLVFDPHDDKRTWPDNAIVIGGGQDYDSISNELLGLLNEVKHRYELRSEQGLQPNQFTPIFFVMDEWREVVANRDEVKNALRHFLTSLRKVNMGFLLISQTDRADPLGLRGESDLRESFEGIVRLSGNKKVGITAKLETVDGEIIIEHPGPYEPKLLPANIPDDNKGYEVGKYTPPIDTTEQRVMDMYNRGTSITEIGRVIYGDGTKGGEQNKLVKAVLKKHKLI